MAIEAITNIRTVASLGKEQSLFELYDKELLSGERTMHIKSIMRGFAFALGQTAPFLCYGISLWYGGVLVADEGLPYKDVIKVSTSFFSRVLRKQNFLRSNFRYLRRCYTEPGFSVNLWHLPPISCKPNCRPQGFSKSWIELLTLLGDPF